MASITELLLGSTLQAVQKAPNPLGALTDGIQQGAQLANQIEQTKIAREKMEAEKNDIRNKKLENMTDDILKARKLGGKALSGYREFLKNKSRVLKLEDVYSPEAIDLVTSVPENIDRFDVIVGKVTSGELSFEDASQTLKDEGLFYEVDPVERQRLAKAAEVATLEANKKDRAEIVAQATTDRAREARDDAGQVELDKKLAIEASKFKGAGGEANLRSKIKKLDDVIKAFENDEIPTGSTLQSLPITGGETANRLFRKKFKDAEDVVKGVINVKQILDSQFGDKALAEVQRNLGLDGALTKEQNLKRMKELRKSMLGELDSKVKEFKKRGFIGKNEKSAPEPKGPAAGADSLTVRGKKVPKAALVEAAKKNPNLLKQTADAIGMTLEQLKEELGIE